jgi:MtrB/PioB family decaheme-associated outer membrane protein
MADLMTSLKNVELETERQRFGGGMKWHFTDNWGAQANYRHEIKEGSDPIGAVFGSNGGNPRASILAVPIDYETDEFDAGIAYTGSKGQYSLNYHLSLFNNNDTSVFWENPFVNNAWADGAGNPANHPTGVGRLSLSPDNQAHQVKFSGGYNFTPKTRGTATVSYSRWLQDQKFLPYTNLTLAAPPPVSLPRSSLDGDIATLFANFAFYHRLTNKLDVKAAYTLDDRENHTPRDIYLRMPGDVIAAQPAITDDGARQNWTYDMTRHLFELDGGYRILPMTKLELGYTYERKERNLSEVNDTNEHTGKIRLSASPFDTASGWIKYQHSVLDGSDYVSNRPFLTGHSPEHIDDIITNDCGGVVAGCSDLFENNHLLRKFHFADRERNHVQAAVNYYPLEKWTFAVNGEYRHDDFDDSQLGLQKSRNYNVTFDVNFHPNDRINMYAFATHENYKYDQRGFQRSGDTFGPGDPLPGGANRDFWTTDTEDMINMVGAGFDWFVIEDKFKLNLDFTYSRAYTQFDQASGPNLTDPVRLPDVTTRITTLGLTGDYKLKDNMKLRLRYMYERFNSQDFGLDGVDVNTLGNVILLGQRSPDYVAHVFGISFVYEFQ